MRDENPATPSDQHAPGNPVDRALAGLLSDLRYPIAIVTATDGPSTAGCLVGLHKQTSINPMRVAVFLEHQNYTFEVATNAQALTVHYPSVGDHALAERFGSRTGPDADKFSNVDLIRTEDPSAVELKQLEQRWVGRIEDSLDCGDHTMFLLSPVRVRRAASFRQLSNVDVTDVEPGQPRRPANNRRDPD